MSSFAHENEQDYVDSTDDETVDMGFMEAVRLVMDMAAEFPEGMDPHEHGRRSLAFMEAFMKANDQVVSELPPGEAGVDQEPKPYDPALFVETPSVTLNVILENAGTCALSTEELSADATLCQTYIRQQDALCMVHDLLCLHGQALDAMMPLSPAP